MIAVLRFYKQTQGYIWEQITSNSLILAPCTVQCLTQTCAKNVIWTPVYWKKNQKHKYTFPSFVADRDVHRIFAVMNSRHTTINKNDSIHDSTNASNTISRLNVVDLTPVTALDQSFTTSRRKREIVKNKRTKREIVKNKRTTNNHYNTVSKLKLLNIWSGVLSRNYANAAIPWLFWRPKESY